jgi:hypothetical protein
MGMDVMGNNPISERGEYFRNNVWWWRPLWDYCCYVDSSLGERVPYGHSNDGDGLKTAEECQALARLLLEKLENGEALAYIKERDKAIAELEWDTCRLCEGSGIRADKVGVEGGMPDKELPEDIALLVGRTKGTCNGCRGFGKTEPWESHYPLNEENIREFAGFLQDCGGFSIC